MSALPIVWESLVVVTMLLAAGTFVAFLALLSWYALTRYYLLLRRRLERRVQAALTPAQREQRQQHLHVAGDRTGRTRSRLPLNGGWR